MGMPAVPETVTTIDALLALPDDGMRHELLDGVHAVQQLVAHSVVRQREQRVDRRDRFGNGWHTHKVVLLGRAVQDMAEDRGTHAVGCHRLVATGSAIVVR